MSVELHISRGIRYIWLWFLVRKCKMMTSPDAFFIFSKFWCNLPERVKNGSKWQKMSHSVFLEPYLIWLWFLVHMCKMIVSPAIFFIFSKFWFFVFNRGRSKRTKNDPELPISVCYTLYLKNCRSYNQYFWYTDVK